MTKKISEPIDGDETTEVSVKVEPDDFDMSEYAISADQPEVLLKKVIIQVPVKKPDKQKFFRVLKGKEWEIQVRVLEIKDGGEYFLVRPEALPYVVAETKLVKLYTAYYQNGNVFLIPVPQPDENGKWNQWHQSLFNVVELARDNWVRAVPENSINGYSPMVAQGDIRAPPLPADLFLNDYLKIAFRDHIIDGPDHPVIRQLMGAS